MDKNAYYKYMFLSGAIWNWVLGLVNYFGPIFITDSFVMFGVAEPPSLIFYHLFFGIATIFGIGFYLVSTDLEQYHGIILIGAIGKIYVFSIVAFYFIQGDINLLGVFPSIGDLIYGILFIEFLINYKKL